MESLYKIRNNCIFCDNELLNLYFDKDLRIPLCCYSTKKIEDSKYIPYNVYTCSHCNTLQTKYLGNLNEIYKINHADSTGTIMKGLHNKVKEILITQKNIILNNIVEIGAAKGLLSDIILDNNIVSKYYIIEPNYFGTNRDNKYIINKYFENTNSQDYEDCNTILMSHVFEHFYNPMKILSLIEKNKNIDNVILVWPDLEHYKDNNIYHILNTEHTYYIDNNFIIDLFNNISFKLIDRYNYLGHSVIFVFKQYNNLIKKKIKNTNYDFLKYFNQIIEQKKYIEEIIKKNKNDKKICLWPASVHNQFLLMFLNDIKIDYFLDNSPNKINNYLYGYNIKILDFEKIKNNNEYIILLNGGLFNSEVLDINNKNMYDMRKNTNTKYISMFYGLSLMIMYFYIFFNNPDINFCVNIKLSIFKELRESYDLKCIKQNINLLKILIYYNNIKNVTIMDNNINYPEFHPARDNIRENLNIFRKDKYIIKKDIVPLISFNLKKKYIVINTKILPQNFDLLKDLWNNRLKRNLCELINKYNIIVVLIGEKKDKKCKEYKIHKSFSIYKDLVDNINNVIDLTSDDTEDLYDVKLTLKNLNILQHSIFNICIGFGGSAILYFLFNNSIIFSKKCNLFNKWFENTNHNQIFFNIWTDDEELLISTIEEKILLYTN